MEEVAQQAGPTPTENHVPNRLHKLLGEVTDSARGSSKFDKTSMALSQLALGDLSLHGREDHLELLKSKLRDFTAGNANNSSDQGAETDHLLLVAGASG